MGLSNIINGTSLVNPDFLVADDLRKQAEDAIERAVARVHREFEESAKAAAARGEMSVVVRLPSNEEAASRLIKRWRRQNFVVKDDLARRDLCTVEW